ncbi:MAG: hypothetical protein RBT46_02680 [Weeksellaceae bacterium]|jgi:hypothetical protein|nr:hypothetical protein [Weeksellaceae bacterium]MDX9704595.1 hypothetical protein [Weeksellaceae bacterium]
MKKNPVVSGLLITIGITVLCYLVYIVFLEKKDSYLITNPSEEYLEVQIDGQKYTIAPQQYIPIQLKGGEHSLQFDFDGKSTDTVFMVTRANAVINPTRSDYYVFIRPYGGGRNVDSLFTSQTLTIDERVYNGNITHYNDLYIQDFYYNLDQDYPKMFLKKGVEVNLSKIFSKSDFKQFYFENYE